MSTATTSAEAAPQTAEHFDVLIVGAGISGVGGAYHLQQQCPGTTFVLLDALDHFGGTWWTHKYPGIRSDSDLYTFGYRFKPWTGPPIATAEEILKYMGEVIDENDLARHIRYRHKIQTASWSSETNQWTVEAKRTDTGERFRCVIALAISETKTKYRDAPTNCIHSRRRPECLPERATSSQPGAQRPMSITATSSP